MISSYPYCQSPAIQNYGHINHTPTCGQYLFMILMESYLMGKLDLTPPSETQTSVEPEETYDFIVVGAGTAGSIVAGRLSESGEHHVLLLEAGGPEPVVGRIPGFYLTSWLANEAQVMYQTEPGNYCLENSGGVCFWRRGRVVGGTSVLNGMMYHRGHAADYDVWVNVTNDPSWSWQALQPFFDMGESNKQIGTLVSSKYHSAHGQMPVQQFNNQPAAIYDMLRWLQAAGFPIIKDLNDPHTPIGFTVAQAFNNEGERYTTARAYLAPRSERPNLSLTTYAYVTRVIFDGKRAIGVEYLDKKKVLKTVYAAKEVILSGGSLNTPQILMLSGVGPKRDLEKLGISVRADLPVGQNLRNHIGAMLPVKVTGINNTRSRLTDQETLNEYLLTRGGIMSSTGLTQLSGELYTRFGNRREMQPDLQFFFSSYYPQCSGTGVIENPVPANPDVAYIIFDAVALLPRSVGYMTLNSLNPLDPPRFYANYLDNPVDILMLSDGLKYFEQLFYSKNPLSEKIKVELDKTYTNVCDCIGVQWSDRWLECMIRRYTDPQNHQLGTTALGSVVDTELKVYSLTNLRVCDAGSIPIQTTGNVQGPIMALAERCAYLIQKTWQSI